MMRRGARATSTTPPRCSRARACASPPSTCSIAREHFAAKGVHVDLIKLYGSMELAPLTGLADAIVDLVSTGSTLKANDLVEVEEIMPISARLVVNQAALKLKRERDAAADRRVRGRGRRHDASTIAPARHRERRTSKPSSRALLALDGAQDDRRSSSAVAAILADVRERGDAAVLEYTRALRPRRRRRRSPSSRSRRPSCARALAALPRGAARCAARRPPRASARFHERQLAAVAGATATPTARCSARRSRRSTASASTCPAARRPIRRRC